VHCKTRRGGRRFKKKSRKTSGISERGPAVPSGVERGRALVTEMWGAGVHQKRPAGEKLAQRQTIGMNLTGKGMKEKGKSNTLSHRDALQGREKRATVRGQEAKKRRGEVLARKLVPPRGPMGGIGSTGAFVGKVIGPKGDGERVGSLRKS